MKIIILGSGCTKCKTTYDLVQRIINESEIEASLEKEEDIMEILKYDILSTPAIVVDGVVKIKGHIPSEAEVRNALNL